MKKVICVLFVLIVTKTFSQAPANDLWRSSEIFRIPLKEKINLPLRKLPVELIRAFCEGSLKGYYPQDSLEECSYHEFTAHFNLGVNQPAASGKSDEFQGLPCPESFCSNNDENMLENFLTVVDLVQVTRFDKNKSMEIAEVKYVKLKYIYEKAGIEIILDGPVFKYSDIVALSVNFPDRYKIPNPKNTAENFTVKKVLDSRMFTGGILGKKTIFQNPTEDKKKNTEKDIWHN